MLNYFYRTIVRSSSTLNVLNRIFLMSQTLKVCQQTSHTIARLEPQRRHLRLFVTKRTSLLLSITCLHHLHHRPLSHRRLDSSMSLRVTAVHRKRVLLRPHPSRMFRLRLLLLTFLSPSPLRLPPPPVPICFKIREGL